MEMLEVAAGVAGGGGVLGLLGFLVWKLADAVSRKGRDQNGGNGSRPGAGCDPLCVQASRETREMLAVATPVWSRLERTLDRLVPILERMDERDRMRSTGEHRIAGG